MELEDIILGGIEAIIPDYDDRGNYTKLYTIDGKIHKLDKSFWTVRNQICKHYLMDFKAARKYFGEITFMKNLAPISFDGKDVFVYIKVRNPVSDNDGAHGLINTTYVEKVTEEDDEVIIKLQNNGNIKSLWTFKNTMKHINIGNKLRKQYSGNLPLMGENLDFNKKYNKPITLGDIVFLMEKTLESLDGSTKDKSFPEH